MDRVGLVTESKESHQDVETGPTGAQMDTRNRD